MVFSGLASNKPEIKHSSKEGSKPLQQDHSGYRPITTEQCKQQREHIAFINVK